MSNNKDISPGFLSVFKKAYLRIAQIINESESLKKRADLENESKSLIFLFLTTILESGLKSRLKKQFEIHDLRDLIHCKTDFYSQFKLFNEIVNKEKNLESALTQADSELRALILEVNESQFNIGLLGKAYEYLLPYKLVFKDSKLQLKQENSSRKSLGAYYTPSEIVDYIIEQTLGRIIEEVDNYEDLLKVKILDPASGCGQFILGTLEFIHKRFQNELKSKELQGLLLGFASNCLYAVDLDSSAIDICKIGVWLKSDCEDFKHFVSGNSLITPENKGESKFLQKHNFVNWNKQFPEVFNNENPGFDIVLGNPPYISFSGRQAEKLDNKMLEHFKAHFDVKGWLTTQSLFTELAINHLSKRFTSFIVPSQVAQLEGYSNLRNLIDSETVINDLKNWGENVFNDACTPAITFVLTKEDSDEKPEHQDFSWNSISENTLLDKISEDCFYLDKLVADPGVHTGNCAKKLIKRKNSKSDFVPILEGKQIHRYKCLSYKKFLDLSYSKKEGEYFAIRPLKKYQDAEFIIRQTASHPIIAPRTEAIYFRNSALALYSPKKDYDVRYLAGILNSKLIKFVYQEIISEAHQKAFPQVKVRNLRKLPIKQIDFENENSKKLHDQLVCLVEKIISTESIYEFNKIDSKIDKLVFKIYSLTPSEIKQIEESI